MELKDTIEMMISPDYKERFKAEVYQLRIRMEKLERVVNHYDDGTLGFTPTSSKGLLQGQLRYMQSYYDMLEFRAEHEGIKL